jgi:primosomal replication protein N
VPESILKPNVRANQLVLVGCIHDRKDLRILPNGLPILECTLWHESQVTEASADRSLGFLMPARCLGPVAERLARLQLGASIRAWGFIAPRRQARLEFADQARPATSLIFTINEFTLGE